MELMIVIIILGLLATLVMPNILGKSDQAKQQLVCIQMKNLSNSLKMFKADNGSFPSTEEGIKALSINPNDKKYKKYPNGGYIEDNFNLKDPWENEYIYIYNNKDKNFEIISLGADGLEGGNDSDKDISLKECTK